MAEILTMPASAVGNAFPTGRAARPGHDSTELNRPTTWLGIFATWQRRRCFRHHLARLSKDGALLIDDIGLTMGQVQEEIRKPFWRT